MRQQDTSSNRYIYSSISVQLIDQCMLQAAVARESSSPASRIINCCCCIMSLCGCLPVSRLGVPTALELGVKKPTRKKKRKNSFDFIHNQMWWEKKDQFVSLTLAVTMALRCNATVSLQATCLSTDDVVISLSVHALQCHSHIPKTSLLPNSAPKEEMHSQEWEIPSVENGNLPTVFQQAVLSSEQRACELCSEGLRGKDRNRDRL